MCRVTTPESRASCCPPETNLHGIPGSIAKKGMGRFHGHFACLSFHPSLVLNGNACAPCLGWAGPMRECSVRKAMVPERADSAQGFSGCQQVPGRGSEGGGGSWSVWVAHSVEPLLGIRWRSAKRLGQGQKVLVGGSLVCLFLCGSRGDFFILTNQIDNQHRYMDACKSTITVQVQPVLQPWLACTGRGQKREFCLHILALSCF